MQMVWGGIGAVATTHIENARVQLCRLVGLGIRSGLPAADELKVASRQVPEPAISGGRALRGVRGSQRQPRARRAELGAIRSPGRENLNKTERANQVR